MIASLRGVLRATSSEGVVIDVGGVGFRAQIPESLRQQLPRIGQTVELHTHMAVRQNDITLYGFGTAEELELFRVLLGVSGIGPRTALATLSAFSPEALRSIIASGDAAALARTPGIGRKTAQRLLLDLRDRLGGYEAMTTAAVGGGAALSGPDAEVMAALTALGYSQAEAQAAIAEIPDDVAELDARILTALRLLSSR